MAIQRRKAKSGFKYRVLVRDRKGAWFPVETFDTLGEARDHETKLKGLKVDGVHVSNREVREETLAQFWARWAKDCRTDVADGWKGSQDQMWRDHLEPILGLVPLIELGRPQVAQLMAKLKAKGLGDQTRLHCYNLLHKMMEDAIDIYEARAENPVTKRFKPTPAKVERKYYKPADARRYLASVADHRFGPALWIMVMCAPRAGETQALRRRCVDLDAATLTITEQWLRKEKPARLGPVKNRKPIVVPLLPELVKYLRGHRGFMALRPDAYIAANPDGSMVHHMTLYKAVKRTTAAAGLEVLSPHGLRHTAAMLWKDRGASLSDRKALLNHSSERSSAEYDHDANERLRRLADAPDNVIPLRAAGQ
jgi:integrase